VRTVALTLLVAAGSAVAAPRPFYLWLEADWFRGVEGTFSYAAGTARPTGHWGIAGPGVSAEWSQGGESEWNSIGVPAEERSARAWRDVRLPHAGRWRIWVRGVDHRDRAEPFTVLVEQPGRAALRRELGVEPVVPRNDEYALYWGFSFGWWSVDAELAAGPARVTLAVERPGEAWRQLDALLLTDDLAYRPVAREKPPFPYFDAFALDAPAPPVRGSGAQLAIGASWKRPRLDGDDFTLWVNTPSAVPPNASLRDLFFAAAPPPGLAPAFAALAAATLPIVSSPHLRPVFSLAQLDLSPGTPLRAFLDRTRVAFAVLTNYAQPAFTPAQGAATAEALQRYLPGRLLGFIHGEAVGTVGVGVSDRPLAPDRRGHLDALLASIAAQQFAAWERMLYVVVDKGWLAAGITCLSSDLGNELAHALRELGARLVGYEEDATAVHVPLRLAFQRGAARQYEGGFINYASGNFGDACNYFYPTPPVACGSGSWFHSKYSLTDGVSISWYRKLYYLNYLGGASAVYLEQGLQNQFMKPGPGDHPVQLSPFGRATADFLEFVDRVPDRGEPYTPVALLLSAGHGYEHVSYRSRALQVFDESPADRALRELFNVLWHPAAILEGQPAAPDVQSLPSGVFGNLFDVLVDRPERARAIFDYAVVWAAGDVRLGAPWRPILEAYLRRGGTLVIDVTALDELGPALAGLRTTGRTHVDTRWRVIDGDGEHETTPYERAEVALGTARPLFEGDKGAPLVARNTVGDGAVVTILVPHGIGLDERAHPVLPRLADALTRGLAPVEVRLADGRRPGGEVLYQVNRTSAGWLVLLMNNRGVDKTQNGIARVDRRASVDLELVTRLPLGAARELTQPRALAVTRSDGQARVRLRVEPGDLQVVSLSP
jgi:hypothetical protein